MISKKFAGTLLPLKYNGSSVQTLQKLRSISTIKDAKPIYMSFTTVLVYVVSIETTFLRKFDARLQDWFSTGSSGKISMITNTFLKNCIKRSSDAYICPTKMRECLHPNRPKHSFEQSGKTTSANALSDTYAFCLHVEVALEQRHVHGHRSFHTKSWYLVSNRENFYQNLAALLLEPLAISFTRVNSIKKKENGIKLPKTQELSLVSFFLG